MKRPQLLVLGMTLPLATGVAVVTAGTGQASGDGPVKAAAAGTECAIRNYSAVILPGLSTEPGTSSFYSKPGATISCNGPVEGANPTGPGVYESAGRLGTKDPDSCSSGGEGWAVGRMEIPTDAGTKILRSTFTYTYGALQGGAPVGGEIKGDYFDGTLQVTSVNKGDCVTAPVTDANFDATSVLRRLPGTRRGMSVQPGSFTRFV